MAVPIPQLLPPPMTAGGVTSPTGDAENASPNLATADVVNQLSIKLPKVPVGADGPNGHNDEDEDGEAGEKEEEGEGATSPGGGAVDGLLPVSSSTTPEQMAALLGPSWKSRQPRMCQYCQRMFSNKFNLKQVRVK